MNNDIVGGKWKEIRGSIKSAWNKLTDDDLDNINGKLLELEGKLQTRYGWEKDRARDAVNSFLKTVKL